MPARRPTGTMPSRESARSCGKVAASCTSDGHHGDWVKPSVTSAPVPFMKVSAASERSPASRAGWTPAIAATLSGA